MSTATFDAVAAPAQPAKPSTTVAAAPAPTPAPAPQASAARRRNRSGFCRSRPQPSPVRPSAAMPPRWVMLARASMAVRTRRWLASPWRWAMSPKPQLSLPSFWS